MAGQYNQVFSWIDDRGWGQVWQSTKYPRLQVWVFGSRVKSCSIGRQYRVENWDPEVESLEEAIAICKSGKKRRCIGLPRVYVYRGPIRLVSTPLPLGELRASDVQPLLGSKRRGADIKNKPKKIIIKKKKLLDAIRSRARSAEVELKRYGFAQVRERKEGTRILRRAR